MISSLYLPTPSVFFSQPDGTCYHYSPTTAALLYEVVPLHHRGKARSGHSTAKAEAKMAQELSGRIRTAAIAHKHHAGFESAVWTTDENGEYYWLRGTELPWPGMPTSAAICHVRYLPCPLMAYRRTELEVSTKIVNIRHQDFLAFASGWVQERPYYFPALRQVELAARALLTVIRDSKPYLTVDSLPSFACHAMFKEVGNVRSFSPDLFDKEGNAIPSKTRVNPETYVTENKAVVSRAALVYSLFTNGGEWTPHRVDGMLANDRIENVVPRNFRPLHPAQYDLSVRTADAVFPYTKLLPSSLYFSRFWRHGLERLAFDIDEVAA